MTTARLVAPAAAVPQARQVARTAPRHARPPEPRAPWGPVGRAAGRAAGRTAGSPPGPRAPEPAPRPAQKAPLSATEPRGRRTGAVVAALALVLVGLAAAGVAVAVELGTGGRVVAGVVAAWALAVGGSALRRPG